MIKLYHLRIHRSLCSTVILFSLIFFYQGRSAWGKKKCLFESHIPAYHSLQVLLNGRATAALMDVMDPSLLTCKPFVAENGIDQWEENLIPCGHRRLPIHPSIWKKKQPHDIFVSTDLGSITHSSTNKNNGCINNRNSYWLTQRARKQLKML